MCETLLTQSYNKETTHIKHDYLNNIFKSTNDDNFEHLVYTFENSNLVPSIGKYNLSEELCDSVFIINITKEEAFSSNSEALVPLELNTDLKENKGIKFTHLETLTEDILLDILPSASRFARDMLTENNVVYVHNVPVTNVIDKFLIGTYKDKSYVLTKRVDMISRIQTLDNFIQNIIEADSDYRKNINTLSRDFGTGLARPAYSGNLFAGSR